MLRKIIIALGFFIAILQFLGFPFAIARWMWTFSGLLIVMLLLLSRKGEGSRVALHVRHTDPDEGNNITLHATESNDGAPRLLHVERLEVEEYPRMHVEKKTIKDTERITVSASEETIVEQNMTVTKRRRRKPSERNEQSGDF